MAAVLNSEIKVRPWKLAIGWLAFLGPFFFVTYGLANTWTSRLPNVNSIVWEWEKQIPFVPWTILPYMSIDAFYALSLFICTSRTELNTHAKRLLSATLISITGFLLFPLKFSFIRPPTEGFNKALFDVLTGFDKPFNQAPSLHISLLMLLWAKYMRHTHSTMHWFIHSWFALIGLSVFTTFQHHIIDGMTGAMVGIFCFYIFPDIPTNPAHSLVIHQRCSQSLKLQQRYLISSLVCFVLAFYYRRWAWLFIWPGLSLFLVSLAYGHFGTRIFQKHQGKLSWSAYILLLPYHLSAWLSSRWFTCNIPASAEIIPGIWIGRIPSSADLIKLKPQSIVDLTAEFHSSKASRSHHYRSIPMLDLIVPTPDQLQHAIENLEALYLLHLNRPILVHCALGYSRSAMVVAAWLLYRKFALNPESAIKIIRTARPQIVLSPAHQKALEAFYYDYITPA